MAAQANSTSDKPDRFDLVSECSRFSPISRLSDDERDEEITVKEATMVRDGRESQQRNSMRSKSLFTPKSAVDVMDEFEEVIYYIFLIKVS